MDIRVSSGQATYNILQTLQALRRAALQYVGVQTRHDMPTVSTAVVEVSDTQESKCRAMVGTETVFETGEVWTWETRIVVRGRPQGPRRVQSARPC